MDAAASSSPSVAAAVTACRGGRGCSTSYGGSSSATGRGDGPSLQDLPPDCVIRMFGLIEDVRDVLSLQATCKQFCSLGRSRLVWLPRLQKDLCLKLKWSAQSPVEEQDTSLQQFYRSATRDKAKCLRYWGVMTDGGCDNESLQYWVDNLFAPNHWESYCSAWGRNVHCFGILMAKDHEQDRCAAEDREYIIRKCRYPAAKLFHEHQRFNRRSVDSAYSLLHCWSTPELEQLILALYQDLQNGGPLGAMLEMGLQGEELIRERARMRDLVQRLEHQVPVNARGIISKAGTGKHSLVLYDSLCTQVLNSADTQIVGVIDRLMISRRGSFSCPVSSGVIFIGNITDTQQFRAHEDVIRSFESAAATRHCRALDNLADRESVLMAARLGELPSIVAMHSSAAGEWIEFDVRSRSCSGLQPLVWFHFSTKQEFEVARSLQQGDDQHTDFEEGSSSNRSEEQVLAEEVADALFHGPQIGASEGRKTTGRDRLEIHLRHRVSANLVCVKLVNQEDLMRQWDDDHDKPNIDINCIIFHGRRVQLPAGVHLSNE